MKEVGGGGQSYGHDNLPASVLAQVTVAQPRMQSGRRNLAACLEPEVRGQRFAPSGKREWRDPSRAAPEGSALCVSRGNEPLAAATNRSTCNGARCLQGRVVVNMSSMGERRGGGMRSMLQDKVGWKGRRITMCKEAPERV